MQTIFDSKTLPAGKRRQAWQDAICEIYLRVDCAAESQSSYDGFVREIRFGDVTLTDTLSSPQSVMRQSRHIAQLEKDCYFMGLAQSGSINIRQANSSMTMHAGVGALFNANEPYELRCDTKLRSFWVELPRQAFASRFDSKRPPLTAHLNLSRGLGRIAVEFCSALALEGGSLDPQSRVRLGEQFMDILALAISAEPDRPSTESCVPSGRLLLVRNYIDEHLSDPNLSLRRDREEQRHFFAHASSAVSSDGHVRVRMAAYATTATLLRSAHFAAARGQDDYRDRLFGRVQQFVPFQQSLSRAIRPATVGCAEDFLRVEPFVRDASRLESLARRERSTTFWPAQHCELLEPARRRPAGRLRAVRERHFCAGEQDLCAGAQAVTGSR